MFLLVTYRKVKEVPTEGLRWFNKTNIRIDVAFYFPSECKIFSWLLRGRVRERR